MPDPSGHNLNARGVIMSMSIPLYVSMFYFDISDLSIGTLSFSPALSALMTPYTGSYYQLGSAKKNDDVSLSPRESLAIAYGASGTIPHMYTLREGQDADIGFLKPFFSTEYIDLSSIVQRSLFLLNPAGVCEPRRRVGTCRTRVLQFFRSLESAL
ncbi:hypothetical protein IW261DRAFT_1532382 [Armillaria novae-zelandiae]|uniref:Uncharacterized protein n=1 Tax=Armillaria novae-zelandiae TaxID=153914 RepID=A0AA39N893_9AGAR|nr:hypothetical protein IW261DRAFT_1532382 [Armillaria novae-zelandiae]